MTVRVSKQPVNLREKLSELERPIGLKGSDLMSAATAQEARDLVSAGRKNILINGACIFNQRFGSGTYTLTGSSDYYPVDRFRSWANGGGQFTIQRSDNAPPGFKNSMMYTVSTIDTSVGSSEYYCIQQRIEGYNIAHLGLGTSDAKPVTLSFWVKSDLTGTYSGSFFNTGQSYTCVFEYQINQADIWEYKTLTIPAATIGSFTTDSNYGLGIWWDLGSGTGYNNTPFVWKNAGDFRSANQVPFIGTSGAKFRMTGVQLEAGRNATEFEHRSYGEELALCQRYYWRVPNARWLNGYKRHDSKIYYQLDTPVPMRSTPTPTIHSVGVLTNHQSALGGAVQTTNCTVFEYRPDSGRGTLQIESTYSGTHTLIPSWEAGTIDFNAEL